jgi:2'-5' RNA ligase
MAVAVTLRAVESDAAPLLDLQDEAAAFAAGPSLRELGYGPHVTLAIYDDLGTPEIRVAATQLFEDAVAVELIFEAVRWFEGPSLTLYAAPAPSRALEELARKLNRLIAPERCHPHYRPGCYTPHCTLAMISAERREDAIAFARGKRISFRAAFTEGEGVSLPPPRVEALWHLPSSGAARMR